MLGDNDKLRQTFIFVKTLMNLIDLFSTFYFWFIFSATGYWFIFFKLQERVYCFLPGLDTYVTNFRPFDILFYIVLVMKLIYIVFKIIFEQSSMNIFLIDWERPK